MSEFVDWLYNSHSVQGFTLSLTKLMIYLGDYADETGKKVDPAVWDSMLAVLEEITGFKD